MASYRSASTRFVCWSSSKLKPAGRDNLRMATEGRCQPLGCVEKASGHCSHPGPKALGRSCYCSESESIARSDSDSIRGLSNVVLDVKPQAPGAHSVQHKVCVRLASSEHYSYLAATLPR